MENKYYTPKIEEFHVGFEFEFFDIDDDGNELYEKKVFNEHEEPYYYKDSNSVRVKSLNKEDIESLGFTVFILKMEDYDAFYIKKHNKIIAGWFPEEVEENIEINDLLFTIKNKSELKRLLVQLGIINNS